MTEEGGVKELARYWQSKSLEAEESALLGLRQLSYGKHSAVRGSLHRDFVKTGVLPVEAGMVYNRLFEWRQKADYEAFLEMNEQMVEDLLTQARDWLVILRKYAENEIG